MLKRILAVMTFAFVPLQAQAFCGFYVGKADASLFNESSQVILARDGQWFAMDTGSRNGTRLNGVSLPKGEPAPLADRDHLQVGPWTFQVAIGAPTRAVSAPTVDDGPSTPPRLRTTGIVERDSALRQQILSLLKASSILHSAKSEHQLLELLLESAQAATGFERAAVVRRAGKSESVELLCQRTIAGAKGAALALAPYSRSLLNAAADGPYAVMSNETGVRPMTLVQHDIAGAACAPIKLSDAIWGYLYLDSGGATPPPGTSDLLEVVRALADAASMALASIKQREVQRRLEILNDDIAAAGQIQRILLPPSRAELERRLVGRGTDAPDAIARRLAAVDTELRAVHAFDYAVVNDDIASATDALLTIIAAERAGDTASAQSHWGRARVVAQIAPVLPISKP